MYISIITYVYVNIISKKYLFNVTLVLKPKNCNINYKKVMKVTKYKVIKKYKPFLNSKLLLSIFANTYIKVHIHIVLI